MDTALERIRAKITDLEAKISDLRIAERELQALDRSGVVTTRKPRKARAIREAAPKAKPAATPGRKRGPRAVSASGEPRQTIGGAVLEALTQHGALPVAEIADQIQAAGKDINRRAISFTLQALKKRGLVKSADGRWSAAKGRG
jgi:DNA-binding transcriptional ArsR family regulator